MKNFLRNLAIWAFHISFVRPVLYWGAGVRYRRRELIPEGPCLVVANHNSHLDAAILLTMFPLRRLPGVHPVAAADYFGTSWLKRTMAMLMMNAIPIQRRPARGTDPLKGAVDCLKNGESLILFPEGSRGEAGVVAPFRAGVGRLIRQHPGLLVVPVFLSGPERIWPRGQYVPVPLTVDAIIGKPRNYDLEDEPRVIAERVREDVLALAPPPPPMPAARPAPPRRVAVCGLDAEDRRKVFRAIVRRLGLRGKTLGIGNPVIEADAEGEREIVAPIPYTPVRAWLGIVSRIFRVRRRFEAGKFAEMLEQARIDEAVSMLPAANHVVTDGSALVDLMAWAEADFYAGVFDENGMNHVMQYLEGRRRIAFRDWWKFMRRAPDVWLVNVLDLARPPAPDVLVFASPPTWTLMHRLRSAGQRMGSHQSEAFLERLSRAYALVGSVLRKRRQVEFLEYDPAKTDPEAIAAEVEKVLLRSGAAELEVGSGV